MKYLTRVSYGINLILLNAMFFLVATETWAIGPNRSTEPTSNPAQTTALTQPAPECSRALAPGASSLPGVKEIALESPGPVIPFRQKFIRQTPGSHAPAFRVGETIEGEFKVSTLVTPTGLDRSHLLLTYDDGRLDVRNADKFKVALDPSAFDLYLPFVGGHYQGVVRISTEGRYFVANMFEYDASLVSALRDNAVINPTANAMATLPPNASVRVEGRVIEIVRKPDASDIERHGAAMLRVETPAGDVIDVTLWSGLPKYNGSADPSFELVGEGRYVELGDIVRMNVYPSKGTLATHWTDSTLIRANASAQTKFLENQKVAATLAQSIQNAITSSDYSDARSLISKSMKMDLTTNEKASLETFVLSMPEAERPYLFWSRQTVRSVEAAYGFDLDGMTQSEFVQFCEDVSMGRLSVKAFKIDGRRINLSYFFQLISDVKLPESFQVKIFLQSASTQLSRLENHDRVLASAGSFFSFNNVMWQSWDSLEHLNRQTPDVGAALIAQLHRAAALIDSGVELHREVSSLRETLLVNRRAALASDDKSWIARFNAVNIDRAVRDKPQITGTQRVDSRAVEDHPSQALQNQPAPPAKPTHNNSPKKKGLAARAFSYLSALFSK